MLSLLYLVVKTQHYFVTSSYMFLDEKTVLEIWLNPWLNLTIFRGTGPRRGIQNGCGNPHFQNEAKCTTVLVKISNAKYLTSF